MDLTQLYLLLIVCVSIHTRHAVVEGSPFVTHQFDMSSHVPPHLAVMYSMSWFGINSNDPQGAGPDPTYGNWQWGGGCIPTNNPTTCNTGTNITLHFPAEERWIASKRRPLAGIYSASARDAEGLARVDLMLSHIRRPCDGGANARLDAWSVQQGGIKFSSRYPQNKYCAVCDLSYRALLSFFAEAQRAKMNGSVMGGLDATWIFHFAKDMGLDCTTNLDPCIQALTEDISDMAKIANQFGEIATRIKGSPIFLIYVDGTLSATQWASVLQNARNTANSDFYVIATGVAPAMFEVFDGIAPWTQAQYGLLNPSYAQALSWAEGKLSPFITAAPKYPGRVAFGSLVPGFDDYTMDWGKCQPRVMERNPIYIQAAADYLHQKNVTTNIVTTWDDWTEGHHFEPDVNNGTFILVTLKQGLGKIAGEPSDPVGDKALDQRWVKYGQARNCMGGKAGVPPVTNLAC